MYFHLEKYIGNCNSHHHQNLELAMTLHIRVECQAMTNETRRSKSPTEITLDNNYNRTNVTVLPRIIITIIEFSIYMSETYHLSFTEFTLPLLILFHK